MNEIHGDPTNEDIVSDLASQLREHGAPEDYFDNIVHGIAVEVARNVNKAGFDDQ